MTAQASVGRDDIGTIDDLHASATKLTGLADFGSDDYLPALTVLLDSLKAEAGLTPLGNKVTRASLRTALVGRLLSEVAWQLDPTYESVEIERPIFVMGLPRSGTTALHRLLCADPANQGLELWLTEFPQARPPRDTWDSNPVYARMQEGFAQFHKANPSFGGLHYMTADMVEEDWRLLVQSFLSHSFESLAHVPTYAGWLEEQDWTDAYARHRRNLQMIGSNDAGRRWALKNPSHIWALDAIMANYPDALIVHTVRDPRTTIASMCSLAAAATTGQSTVFVGGQIGTDMLDMWSRGCDRYLEARSRYDSAQFLDVDYREFISDPVAATEGIYRHFGLPLSDEGRAAIAADYAASQEGHRKPAHRYELADFGLTEQQVENRFEAYLDAYFR